MSHPQRATSLQPPDDIDDLQPGAAEQSYELAFTELFRRFWRNAPVEAPATADQPAALPTED